MKLAIISHTEHYTSPDGTLVGWGPTVTELNHLIKLFDKIYHVAMLHDDKPPPSALPYSSDNIIFVPLPPLGGRSLIDKCKLVIKAPKVISTINKTLTQVDYFQFRAPTGIGVFVIPYLIYIIKKNGWFKYAGNWGQVNPPLGYKLQRWFLSNQSRRVTINGKWSNQPEHCLTFENPCLTQDELIKGRLIAKEKEYGNKLIFCYVGRLEKPKGVARIIEAFSDLEETMKNKVAEIHLVGDGEDLGQFKLMAEKSGLNIIFHGFLPRNEVFEIYKKSHVFIMPTTASEGFPKVIAEAMNFGCLPVVSNISSIGYYIKDERNGFLLKKITKQDLVLLLCKVLIISKEKFISLTSNNYELVENFSFEHYCKRIKHEILEEKFD